MPLEQTLYGLSQEDVSTLRDMSRSHRNSTANTRNRPPTFKQENQAPEVYIAYANDDIPGLTGDIDNQGDPSGVQPGMGDATIYSILQDNDPPNMDSLNDLTQTVFNLSKNSIPANSWFTVIRDKFGAWIAGVSGSSSTFFPARITSPYGAAGYAFAEQLPDLSGNLPNGRNQINTGKYAMAFNGSTQVQDGHNPVALLFDIGDPDHFWFIGGASTFYRLVSYFGSSCAAGTFEIVNGVIRSTT
jgi:hypothetical protein